MSLDSANLKLEFAYNRLSVWSETLIVALLEERVNYRERECAHLHLHIRTRRSAATVTGTMP